MLPGIAYAAPADSAALPNVFGPRPGYTPQTHKILAAADTLGPQEDYRTFLLIRVL